MRTLSPWISGSSAAITFAALYCLCAGAVALWPAGTLGFFDAWFHGLDLSKIATEGPALTLGDFLYGLLGVAVVSFLTGALFAASYNLLLRQAHPQV